MSQPELSARVEQLETELVALRLDRRGDRQMLERLRRTLDLDQLTGAFSRSFFDAQLESALRQWRRVVHATPGAQLSVALLDLDHFKRINDSNGHLAGDKALREVVTICRHLLRRETDVVARFGGDEFALLLPQTPLESAAQLAKRICLDVAALPSCGDRITVSIGLAACPLHGERSRLLLDAAADSALYRAKQQRNAVVIAT